MKTCDHLASNPLEDLSNGECNLECNSNSEYYTDDEMYDISKSIVVKIFL